MTQAEFHRRYEQYPEDVKFELVGGVVYMASPMKLLHGEASPEIALVLMLYKASTPGVFVAENATAILGTQSEPQPDQLMRLVPECGGQARVNEAGYLVGAPELVVEVSHATRSLDMNKKRKDYLEAGVQEYAVYLVAEKEIHWFHFPSKRKLKPDKSGIWKSRVFPGLWLDGPALVARDSSRLIATIQQGIASPEHEVFVRKLEERRKGPSQVR